MSAHKYVGLTPAQLAAVISVLALVMNDPTWSYETARQANAVRGAFTALTKAAS